MAHLVRVECREPPCQNTATYDPHELWALFYKKGWSDEFKSAQLRFYCRPCSTIAGVRVKNARMFDMGTCVGTVTHHLPLMTNERDWKRFLNRHKG